MNAIDVFAAARPDVEIDEGVLDDLAAELFDGVPRRAGDSGRWRLLAVAAAVVALVAGLAVIVGRPDAPAPVDTVPPVIPDDGEPLRMLPSDLEGATVVGFLSGREQSTIPSTVLARRTTDGAYVDKVVVRRGPVGELLVETDDQTTVGGSQVESIPQRGPEWQLVSDEAIGWVFAQSNRGDGTALTVAVEMTDDVQRSREIVIDVVTSLANAAQPPTGVAFDLLPTGFEVIAEWAVSNSWVRYASVHGADGAVTKVITHANNDESLAARLMGVDLRPVRVRGADGIATTYLDMQMVIWQETPGQWVVVQSATGGTTDQLVAFAESLRVVTAEEWDRVVEPVDGDVVTPATTAPALPDDGSPLRMLPSDWSAYEFDAQLLERGLPGNGNYVAIARPDGSGGYVAPVWIVRGPREGIWLSEPDWEGEGTFSEFELEGRTMEFVSESGGGRIVQFDVGGGNAVVISAVASAGMTRDDLGRIALALDLDGDTLGLETPPDGYEVVASGRFGEVSEPLRSLNVWRDGKQFAGLSVTVTSNPGFPFRDMGDAIEPVTIRGRAGWVTTSAWQTDDGQPWERSSLRWEEQPGQWVNLEEMNPVTLDELTAFAESLVVVTSAEWERAVGTTDETIAAPATTAPIAGPPGRLLVANGSGMSGLGGQEAATLARQGADVLDAANARGPGARAIAGSRVFVRPGFEELGRWVANEYSVEDVESIDSLLNIVIDVPLDDVDVVLVLGLDAAAAAIGGGDGATAPTVVGDSVTDGAASVLSRRGYLVDVEVDRQLRGTVPWITEIATAVRPNILVVQIGAEGPFDPADVDALRNAVDDVPNVILVNSNADRPWVDANNAMLAGIDRPDDNLILMDWDSLADECPGECFADDGIRLTPAGAAYFAEKLSDITGV